MKFVCDNCSTQYLISDDKISGKGVKVRCKRCGHVIVLRPEQASVEPAAQATDPSGAPLAEAPRGKDEVAHAFDQLLQGTVGTPEDDGGDGDQATEIFRMDELARSRQGEDSVRSRLDEVFAGAESAQVPSEASGSGKADWYLAIGDEQVGPMRMAEVEARWAAGEVGPRSLAWQTGMPEWKTIRELEPLRHLWDGSQAAKEEQPLERDRTDVSSQPAPAAAPADPMADLWSANRRSELASLVEEEISAAKSAPPREEAGNQHADGELEPGGAEGGEVPPWEREDSVVSGEVARPSESYFDSSLDARPEEAAGAPKTYSRSGSVIAGPAYLGGKKSGSRTKLIAIAAGAALLVVVVAGVFFVLKQPPEPPREGAGLTEPVGPADAPGAGGPDKGPSAGGPDGGPAERPPDKPAPPPVDKPGTPGDGASPGAAGAAEDGKGASPPGEEEIVVRKPGETGPKPGEARKPGTSRKPPLVAGGKPPKPPPVKPDPKDRDPRPPDEGSAAASGDQPEKLSQSDISNALKKFVPSMKGCVQQQQQRDPTVTGTMVVTFTIAPSGKVSSFEVTTKEHENTYVASCISFIIKAIKFPQARESSTVPRLPLKLGG